MITCSAGGMWGGNGGAGSFRMRSAISKLDAPPNGSVPVESS